MNTDFRQTVFEISEAAIKTAGGEIAIALTQESLGDSAASVVGVLAEESVAAIAGPVLRVILSVMTRDDAILQALLSEPALTGLREAQDELARKVVGERSITVREYRLAAADSSLARAVTIASQSGDYGKVGFLYLIRGLVSLDMGGDQVAQNDLRNCMAALNKVIRDKELLKRCLQEDLEAMRENRGTGYGLTRTGPLRSEIERLDRQIVPLVSTLAFADSLLLHATKNFP